MVTKLEKLIKSDPLFASTDFQDGKKAAYSRRCTTSRQPMPVTARTAAKHPAEAVITVRGKNYSCAKNNDFPRAALYATPLKNGESLPCCGGRTSKKSKKKASKRK